MPVTPDQAKILDVLNNTGTNSGYNTAAKLPDVVGGVIYVILSIIGLVFLVLIVYAGFQWMLAQGEENKIKSAQSLIINSIIGLAIVIAAYAITYFVINALQQAV